MAKKQKTGFQSAAGLIRYFEEEKTGFKIDPIVIVVLTILTVSIVALAHILWPV
ncbi:MAG: preprotein translocase subunit Sec61beta [Thermoplasmata archaeon]|nr:MAG: preprotein translocase subunit Sec61beta [Thermoplasmata archaeon]KAA0009226.1 MAG: preprotein translocase subunit Sec61beta [Thermoplasmata archaeon]MCD6573761.1 preprotein translocase subunit Sec61beta [Thermoplasmata archaeon]